MHHKEQNMMTQPIQMFEDLTSETSPAGGNDITKTGLGVDQRRMIELRARYARAELLTNGIAVALSWVGGQYQRFVSAIKTDFKLRAAESQLLRMSDRELADLGLCRADIPFAVRETVHGELPEVDHVGHALPANQNLRRVA
jgi:uncharacterized protein YjiS (DUF1127 family)